MIPDHIIDQILERTNIVEVIAGYLPLKRAGRNFKAVCPFHYEKTASFIVSPDKQIFHCFGCGAGGNVFGFLMKYERMEFPEVARMLADKLGIEIPQYSVNKEEVSLHTRIFQLNELAGEFYRYILKNSKAAETARKYLKERGISPETAETFKLGLALEEWRKFFNFARSKNYSEELLKKAGLILPGQNNSYYDRFRNRIIFPIFDSRSRIIAFGGRILGRGEPKYLNSPETPVYTKGRHLYGLNLARDEISRKDYVIIVEGYLDLISPYQAGARNIVASLGTALTPEQCRLLKRYTNDCVILYDADSAGEAASLRGIEVLIEEGLNVRIAALPPGMDPDNFVRERGVEELQGLIDEAPEFFDYQSGILKTRYDTRTISGKFKFASEFLPTVAKIENEVLKSSYLARLSNLLGIDEASLRSEMAKLKDYRRMASRPESLPTSVIDMPPPAEKMLLALMLDETSLIEKIKNEIKTEDFSTNTCREIASRIFEIEEKGEEVNPARLMCHLEGDGIPELLSEISSIAECVVDRERSLNDCIRWLKKERQRSTIGCLQEEIKKAQEAGDEEKITQLIGECNKLLKS